MNEDPTPFTFAGRLVILWSIVIGIGGPLALFFWCYDYDSDRPLLFVICPFGFPLVLSCIGYWVLRFFGIPFWKSERQE